ncbi:MULTISPECIES: bifunctional diaminohydroxyphosphoribosylaminopyrimidine deaminase/5-amino-6-(5-phosphoribosylamino)uracil reductase RibD [unclassified Tenacibaculum]|uniref:bifunctional diaminohydroxyphosphoribosylaminopyrimidine deaminase/5-amino-6-(5-phosphoribosylamino)uracil reductase RibD n=1 Tax=unclassified Tenacibaculum TaxID=2635139 RepID=UPI001F00F634|nr:MULTISPECIES: bifunctional diaminohydroxyphosphoribosylaminopyrimidine deaminase/5-amino-6-(5-phosphoribosylamino)uracil reductase RibD [unclassified Tenacibaculum]MCF2873838.1 bifunctional diaminohydroxyphosphoribosylaminopyrimidine deaminase/5-amino-6-(5-phosphoribosylamino)uracil reductase RibD [Tenacibaculum sp. Cn5-1]MCF2936648.1 bifunctional diaminohydroxyphosphoribosylaminopyrimidine deaminase/5-amino-6-(5-phosphoribosylamino)uracil reductase RibD [Tenacibaculum sp. Cn5-34]MCG7512872.1
MNHEKYIKRCLELAEKGIGTARPNPSVGAVVVYQDRIIGEGYTSAYGGNHAEVNAIHAVKNKEQLKEATIYVTLEPCSHYGKTPPCADLIVRSQIPNVVIGCIDTNSLVAGKGVERLRKAGCSVTVGVLEKECKEQHKRFFTVQNKKRPYIILKWAETNDSFVAPLTKDEQKPVWISNKYSQQLVHKWRSEEHAILVGTNTVIADNPSLTVRSWTGRNPIRIVLDKNLRISQEANVFDANVKTILVTETREEERQISEEKENVIYEEIDFKTNIAQQICEVLQKHHIQSVIVEGGTKTLQTFIDAELWDEARVFIGNTEFRNGVKAPEIKGKIINKESIDNDVLKIYLND